MAEGIRVRMNSRANMEDHFILLVLGGDVRVGHWSNALCCYPHVKLEIGNLIQIITTAPIFQQSHYFRQKYLEIASCAVSLLNNIWVELNTV